MGGIVAKLDESGQQPIDVDQVVFRPGAHCPARAREASTA